MKVDHLCIPYDWVTRSVENRSLTLVGSEESPFLKAIARKARKLGIWCSFVLGEHRPVVVDTETAPDFHEMLSPARDIDCIDHPGLSSCAQAIRDVLSAVGVAGKTVCIVGRGHAVQGLAPILTEMDATVMVVHSKTRNLVEITSCANILVIAAPVTPEDVTLTEETTVIDLVGKFKGLVLPEKYIGDVGKLTTSILLYRAATYK